MRFSVRKVPARGSSSRKGNAEVPVKLRSRLCRPLRADRQPAGRHPAPGTPGMRWEGWSSVQGVCVVAAFWLEAGRALEHNVQGVLHRA